MKKLDLLYLFLVFGILLTSVNSLDYNSSEGFHLTGFVTIPPDISGSCPCISLIDGDEIQSGDCDLDNTPYLCRQEGDECFYEQNCQECGCLEEESCYPEGYCLNVEKCSDNTPMNQCSSNEPYYCTNNGLIEDCSRCGCDSNKLCGETGKCVALPSKSFEGLEKINIQDMDVKIKEKPEYSLEIIKKVFNFKKSEMEIIKFIKPILIKELPEKPDVMILNKTIEDIQKSPSKGEKIIKIAGFEKLHEGVSLSPGERKKEFELLLGVSEDNKPIISLNF